MKCDKLFDIKTNGSLITDLFQGDTLKKISQSIVQLTDKNVRRELSSGKDFQANLYSNKALLYGIRSLMVYDDCAACKIINNRREMGDSDIRLSLTDILQNDNRRKTAKTLGKGCFKRIGGPDIYDLKGLVIDFHIDGDDVFIVNVDGDKDSCFNVEHDEKKKEKYNRMQQEAQRIALDKGLSSSINLDTSMDYGR